MNKKFVWLSILAVIISFIGGFILANALNRAELMRLTAENARLQKSPPAPGSSASKGGLSNEEIKTKIEEAARNPEDFAFQKGLGLALYRYAAVEQDAGLLEEVRKLLDRAHALNPDDYQVLVALGNINYDLGQIKKDPASNLRARELYRQALEKNKRDSNVLTDLGLTYLLTAEPDREKAVEALGLALEADGRNEKALVYMTQARIESGEMGEAGKYLARLKEVNPDNDRIGEFEKKISQK